MNYVFDNMHSAIFNSVSPILWSIFILWCVIATENGQGGSWTENIFRYQTLFFPQIYWFIFLGWIGKLLCWDPFIFLSNISYSVYLVQIPVLFYFLGSARGPLLYTLATIVIIINQINLTGYIKTWTSYAMSPMYNVHRLIHIDGGFSTKTARCGRANRIKRNSTFLHKQWEKLPNLEGFQLERHVIIVHDKYSVGFQMLFSRL